ncbi:hypothetical protein [Sorangium sp. So ce887]|uniref:hypothetical protein n=1 Tax=Sorangium sp. So ce887 TaxID=3133324 RepID=UPI003F610285
MDAGSELADTFAKHARIADNGACAGFESKLFSVHSYYSDPAVKRALIRSHFGKCAFCESFILDTDVGDVEHYRPKAAVKEANPLNTEVVRDVDDHPGYFWLSQTWANLFLSCKQCNQTYKGNRFDVAPVPHPQQPNVFVLPRFLPGAGAEVAMLLDPGSGSVPNPREVLRFDPATARVGAIAGGSGNQQNNQARANRTIEIVGLNRPRLVQARAAHLLRLRALFVLAASGGGVMKADAAKTIFSFQYPQEGPWKAAQLALGIAVRSVAEYSSLAIDALVEWNKELVLVEATLNVAQQQPQRVFVNRAIQLPLQPWVTLAEQARAAAENQIDREGAPDTRDLDESYNEALALYKKTVQAISKNWKVVEKTVAQIHQLEMKVSEVERAKEAKLTELTKREDPLFDLQEEIAKIDRELNKRKEHITLLNLSDAYAAAPGDQARNLVLANTPPGYHDPVKDNAKLSTQIRAAKKAELEKEGQELTKQRLVRVEQKKGLELAAKPFEDEQDKINAKAEEISAIYIDGYVDTVEGIRTDMVDLAHGYRNRGAANERGQRADLLEAVAGELQDFLWGEGPPSGRLKTQIATNKGYPPSIRLK